MADFAGQGYHSPSPLPFIDFAAAAALRANIRTDHTLNFLRGDGLLH